MRDPYDILGVKRGANFDEVKAAHRRGCKACHPDMGGSHEAMVELNTAYAFILSELKQSRARDANETRSNETDARSEETKRRDQRTWEQTYRDIDEELEAMRRASEEREEALRGMRSQAWTTGDRGTWARLTWKDLMRFVQGIARSGAKGLILLFAALVGIGSLLVEANFVSALILLGSGLGFAFSLALKNDKGGFLSAALVLFGIMTIWLPPVRAALFLQPVATISVLILLALIFKFAQAGGTVGLMTGGALALFVISAILSDTARPPATTAAVAPRTTRSPAPLPISPPEAIPTPSTSSRPAPTPTVASVPPEPRTLLASEGALLKFVAGVSYRLKVRTGFATSIRAIQGKVAFDSGNGNLGECVEAFELPVQSGAGAWREIDRTIRACGAGALMTVSAVK